MWFREVAGKLGDVCDGFSSCGGEALPSEEQEGAAKGCFHCVLQTSSYPELFAAHILPRLTKDLARGHGAPPNRWLQSEGALFIPATYIPLFYLKIFPILQLIAIYQGLSRHNRHS